MICAVLQLEAVEQRFGALAPLQRIKPEIRAMEHKNLSRGKRKVEVGTLRYNSDQAFDGNLFFPHFVLTNPCLSSSRTHPRRENPNGSRLTRAVGPQQAENLARENIK